MSFEFRGYTFEGAWADPNDLERRPGVYVIWCRLGDTWTVLHVGESEDVKDKVINHNKIDDWKKRCDGTLYYAATYTPGLLQPGRQGVVQDIRLLSPQATTD